MINNSNSVFTLELIIFPLKLLPQLTALKFTYCPFKKFRHCLFLLLLSYPINLIFPMCHGFLPPFYISSQNCNSGLYLHFGKYKRIHICISGPFILFPSSQFSKWSINFFKCESACFCVHAQCTKPPVIWPKRTRSRSWWKQVGWPT